MLCGSHSATHLKLQPPLSSAAVTGCSASGRPEIAHLVGEALTNKQIGIRLCISEHTVDSHIRKIMNKLGVNTRARIAAWVASHDG